MADITVFGNESYFNEDAKFFKDVYIYGNLYGDFISRSNGIFEGDISVGGKALFNSDVYIVGILTVQKRLDVGIGGTILTTTDGNIGIGSTSPTNKFDVIGNS
jgi:hypothetical protein